MRPVKVEDISLGVFYVKSELVKKFRQNVIITKKLRVRNVN